MRVAAVRTWRRSAAAAVLIAVVAGQAFTDGLWNIPIRTLGGKQVWADVAWHAGWRIQEHALTGHHRVLDPRDVRRAWGAEAACRRVFERSARPVTVDGEHLVVLLHGLGRSRSSLARLERMLAAEGYAVAPVSYASTRRSVAGHADRIEKLLDGVRGPRRVSFVTHSLGGLVAREVLARDSDWKRRLELGRLVMIAPPSRGSALAARAVRWPLVRGLLGPSLRDATPAGARELPRPDCALGIVVGGRGDERGWCPLIPGDDDGVVGVEEARLDDVDSFLVVEGLHTFLAGNEAVIAAVREFLGNGRFTPASRTPRPAPSRTIQARRRGCIP